MIREEWNAMTDDEKWDDHESLIVAFLNESKRSIEYDRWNEELSERVFRLEDLETHVNGLMGHLETWKKQLEEARQIIKDKIDGSVDR